MDLNQWAIRHGVSHAALAELRRGFGQAEQLPFPEAGASEAAVQTRVRLMGSALGWRLWRNNVGGGKLSDGSFVRWGLANDSAGLNAKLKSSDLIGCRPVLIGPSDVGRTIGQFVSLEIKQAGWTFSGTEREVAQDAWLRLVTALGGHARFVTDERGIE